ncbi:hypothetical protein [Actinoplanes sp. NPDC020271]|uniref:hypothetical protein n=1 Tax=Actinoplanes sp. NPDC020271 TaxID=3363896 RepID=UPI00379D6A83
MTGQLEQWFHFGPWVFDISAATALVAAAPRDTHDLDVTAWATAYGLTHLDDEKPTTASLIGPTPDGLDRLYAMSTDLTNLVLLGMVHIGDQQPAAMLIDGVHRLYHAWRTGVPQLPAHLLTSEETLLIQHGKLLGPGHTSIIRRYP